ncbi:hypothetical protein GGP85_002921 [Salinibacter ruber]|uniref:DUF1353 domain-containing protein n=1 Tax=Salinibacter ruber TaxID=146919 RepID=UPI00216A1D29|nr:DUF1353 domain-containing protein [Salinibacter ruber]MCS3827451.1 hypothetical protein [Salinibacter ruber]
MPTLFPEPRTTTETRSQRALGHTIVVPAGAEWAPTVPFVEPSEGVWRASLYHDVLYRCRGNLTRTPARVFNSCGNPRTLVSRRFADRFWLARMAAEGVPYWKRRSMYYSVRAVGLPIWIEKDQVSFT